MANGASGCVPYKDDMWRRASAALAHARREEAVCAYVPAFVRKPLSATHAAADDRTSVPRPAEKHF